MLKDLFKKSLRFAAAFVLWVFLLSVPWRGETLFAHAHELLVENSLVEFFKQQLVDSWERVYGTALETYDTMREPKPREQES